MAGSAKQSIAPRRHCERSAIAPRRHCERSEAIHLATVRKNGLLRSARNDVELQTRLHALAAPCATRWLNPSCALLRPSLRAQRSNPSCHVKKGWIASSLRSSQRRRSSFNHTFAASPRVSMRNAGCTGEPSLRANGSRIRARWQAPRSNPSPRAVIASAAKQSISPRKERMDCFAPLAMTWNCRRDFAASPRNAPEPLINLPPKRLVAGLHRPPSNLCESFFSYFSSAPPKFQIPVARKLGAY